MGPRNDNGDDTDATFPSVCPDCYGGVRLALDLDKFQIEAVCVKCGRIFGKIPTELYAAAALHRPTESQMQKARQRLRRTEPVAFRIRLGTKARPKEYNARIPACFKPLIDSDVLLKGSIDLANRSFVLDRVRLNTRVLLGILFSPELKHDIARRSKPISFHPFLPWNRTPANAYPGPSGRIYIVKQDGTLGDSRFETLTIEPEEVTELLRELEPPLLGIGLFLLKKSARGLE